MNLPYFIHNVFAESTWGGNPLAIVPVLDGAELSDEQMQLLARQFNLSETVFITPAKTPDSAAHLRIFTPEHEMPFAGHPTIGASAWLHTHLNLPNQFKLSTQAKTVTIQHNDGVYQFELSGYESAPCALTREQLASALTLNVADIAADVRWMNAGTWQLIIPIDSRAAVLKAHAHVAQLRDASVDAAHTNAYIWHEVDGQVSARYFFDIHGAGLEDPGTGSACANLGAWAHLHGRVPAGARLNWHITQAETIHRPNHLYLKVQADGRIAVGGRVQHFAQGHFSI